MKNNILIFNDYQEINTYLVDLWKTLAKKYIEQYDRFTVALSGGNTPSKFYQRLSEEKTISWLNTYFFQVDDRFVPFDHPDNNFTMIKKNLFDKIPINKENIFYIDPGYETVEKAAGNYEQTLRAYFKTDIPVFDLLLLGVGTDGHTASLFDKSIAINEIKHPVSYVTNDNIKHNRISITYPVINNARHIIIIATGDNKAEIVKQVWKDGNKAYPISSIRMEYTTLILDKQASALL